MIKLESKIASKFASVERTNQGSKHGIGFHGKWKVKCWGPDGKEKFTDEFNNLVVNVGLDDILGAYFTSTAAPSSKFVGLLNNASCSIAAADTMTSHAWSEQTAYSGNRVSYKPGAVSGQSIDNSTSTATFSVTSSMTVTGAFLCDAAAGTSGVTLYAAGAFTGGSKTLGSGDTLAVTATFTAAAT